MALRRRRFSDREAIRIINLKPAILSDAACAPAIEGEVDAPNPLLLPEGYEKENIFVGFREEAFGYFERRRIKWHSLPHLLCSQTSSVNFWFGFMHEPARLAELLRALGFDVAEVLPFELDSIAGLRRMRWALRDAPLFDPASGQSDPQAGFLAFEWIGEKNYLREITGGRVAGDNSRTRGQYFTSADLAVRFRRSDGKVQIVLIEWKYTECYPNGACKRVSDSGTDRLERIYRPALGCTDCQITAPGAVREALFFDPFDQMMRDQLLASAMERAGEQGAQIVSYLHIGPRSNQELMERITSPGLAGRGNNIHDVWASLVRPDRFQSCYLEDLLPLVVASSPDRAWAEYLKTRFGALS